MRYAILENGVKISANVALSKNSHYCPLCNAPVVVKNGTIREPHFAHKTRKDCVSFSVENKMTDWHKNWQALFVPSCVEVSMRGFSLDLDVMDNHCWEIYYMEMGIESNKEYIHRADVCCGNTVVEFQHSKLSNNNFEKRNWFYAEVVHKNVIWVFDLTQQYENDVIYQVEKKYNGYRYEWKTPFSTFGNYDPRHQPSIKVYFELETGWIRQLLWCAENKYKPDYKKIVLGEKIPKQYFAQQMQRYITR